jgi:cysteine desulfurase
MANENRIYFDNAATTRMDPRVEEAMRPFSANTYGNPSSMHREGREARQALESARQQIAATLGVKPSEIVFTGSGTEADNSAIIGIFRMFSGRPFHMITSKIEHPAILEACRYIEECGAKITYLGADAKGMIKPEDALKALTPDTRILSVMAANNVTGILQPISALAAIAHQRGVLFHSDAVQAYGKIAIDMPRQQIDLLSISAHKLHGPKGVGALVLRGSIPFHPLLHGGGQEDGRRSSTQNVAGIIGLAQAATISFQAMLNETARLAKLRDRLWQGIKNQISCAYLIGDSDQRLPGHLCVGFSGLEGEAIKLLLALDEAGIAVSSGSACSSHKSGEPSYVLSAMGFDPLQARGSLRITLGNFNNEAEVERFLEVLPRIISDLRPISTIRKIKEN